MADILEKTKTLIYRPKAKLEVKIFIGEIPYLLDLDISKILLRYFYGKITNAKKYIKSSMQE